MAESPDALAATPGLFTVDVEDWFHPLVKDPTHWDLEQDRVAVGVHLLLELLSDAHCTATFFVLGWIAERHPELVGEILAGGHEVGSHGHLHRPIGNLTPAEFERDLERSLDALAAAGATDVIAYRAPYFSLEPSCDWALPILHQQGIRIDSSVFPMRTGYYGSNSAPITPHRLGPILEVPISLPVLAGLRVPVTGGFYARFFPRRLVLGGVSHLRRHNVMPVFYVHPWELDPAQPVRWSGAFLTFRHYLRLRETQHLVTDILASGPWVALRDGLARALASGATIPSQ